MLRRNHFGFSSQAPNIEQHYWEKSQLGNANLSTAVKFLWDYFNITAKEESNLRSENLLQKEKGKLIRDTNKSHWVEMNPQGHYSMKS